MILYGPAGETSPKIATVETPSIPLKNPHSTPLHDPVIPSLRSLDPKPYIPPLSGVWTLNPKLYSSNG